MLHVDEAIYVFYFCTTFYFIFLRSCKIIIGKCTKVGLLVSDTIDDQVWGTKGYKGLLRIQAKFDAEVFYREGVNSKAATAQAVKQFHQKESI